MVDLFILKVLRGPQNGRYEYFESVEMLSNYYYR